jgi:hypothetical protein
VEKRTKYAKQPARKTERRRPLEREKPCPADGAGKSAASGILREWGIKPHLTETFPFSTGTLFEEKPANAVGLYMNPPDNAVILCMDEKSRIRALERTRPLPALRENIPARRRRIIVLLLVK